MGDPKRIRKKYSTPMHPWNKAAIDEEAIIRKDYGIRRKKEIYLMNSFLKRYRSIAKRLSIETTAQAEKESREIVEKLQRYGLLPEGASLNNILALTLKDVLERRLQTVVFRKGMARSMKQARQFITHRHIVIGDKEITAPSYFLTLDEEASLGFKGASTLSSEDHPERADKKAEEIKAEAKALKEQTKKLKSAKSEESEEDILDEAVEEDGVDEQ